MKLSEMNYNWLIKWAKNNGSYLSTNDYERACVLFERTKKDYKKASFHTYNDFYYICLNEEGRNNFAKKFIYRIRQYEDEVEYYRSLLEEVMEQNERLKERG